MEKNFEEWMGVKEKVHNAGRLTGISEGQIWWAAIGENVGVDSICQSGTNKSDECFEIIW